MNVTMHLTDQPDPAARTKIIDALIAFNVAAAGVDDFHTLAVLLSNDEGETVGGLWGRTVFGWLYVELLFVPESLRHRGLGSELLRLAEAEALRRGCRLAWLDTFEFQARPFYERHGYTLFGELGEYPAGFSRFFMKKTLATPVA